jgi:phage terminase large subunit GpA-like protein
MLLAIFWVVEDQWGTKFISTLLRFGLVALGVLMIGKLGKLLLRGWRHDHSPFRPFCPHCGKHVRSDLEWKCGFCDGKNTDTKTFSFLYKCQHCDAIPKAYRCHQCGQTIFLDADKDDKHCATGWTPPVAVENNEDSIRKKWERDKEQLQQALELSRLATEVAKQKTQQRLAEAAGDPEKWKPKSPRELQEEEFARVQDVHLARLEIIARAKKQAEAEPDLELRGRKVDVLAWMGKEWGIE